MEILEIIMALEMDMLHSVEGEIIYFFISEISIKIARYIFIT